VVRRLPRENSFDSEFIPNVPKKPAKCIKENLVYVFGFDIGAFHGVVDVRKTRMDVGTGEQFPNCTKRKRARLHEMKI
jgi:hypothetical protein